MSCTEFSDGLQAGLAIGDPTAIGTLDALFETATEALGGITCSDYGATYVDMCVEDVTGENTFYIMDPTLLDYGMFVTFIELFYVFVFAY